ncbi:hypothetical protein LL270_00890 [Pseudomonas aestusnigri]|uniref:hypothetical protein n=1 Tax=Halopseudomonas aestusnigri TaxID=857252 RepID=UPI001D189BB6|nr:hypothetical protein [Halopseudomonas aestusnigri]MCC4259210.1 hypothetical protein [Halopseudomonas aestusnigri]
MSFPQPTKLTGPVLPLDAFSRVLDVVIAGSPGNQAETRQALQAAITRYQNNGAIERVTSGERLLLNHLQILAAGELLAPRDAYGFMLDAPVIGSAADGSRGRRPAGKPDEPSSAAQQGQSQPAATARQAATPPVSPAPLRPVSPSALQGTAKRVSAHESDLQPSEGGRFDQPSGKPSCK